MREKSLESVDVVCERLAKQRDAAIQYTVFLRDVTKPERWYKYGNSLSGHMINLQIVAVENALVLWASRVWDESRDAQSIPKAFLAVSQNIRKIIRRRSKDWDAQLQEEWTRKQFLSYRELNTEYLRLAESPVRNVVRVLRSENLAHLLAFSDDRRRLFPEGFDQHGVIRNDLFDFVESCIRLIDRIELFRVGHSRNFDESAAVFQSYCDAYWGAVPVFREVE